MVWLAWPRLFVYFKVFKMFWVWRRNNALGLTHLVFIFKLRAWHLFPGVSNFFCGVCIQITTIKIIQSLPQICAWEKLKTVTLYSGAQQMPCETSYMENIESKLGHCRIGCVHMCVCICRKDGDTEGQSDRGKGMGKPKDQEKETNADNSWEFS